MSTLRGKLIRLAHEKPELRPHLLPMLKKAMKYRGIDSKADIWTTLYETALSLTELILMEFVALSKSYKVSRKGNIVRGQTDTHGFQVTISTVDLLHEARGIVRVEIQTLSGEGRLLSTVKDSIRVNGLSPRDVAEDAWSLVISALKKEGSLEITEKHLMGIY